MTLSKQKREALEAIEKQLEEYQAAAARAEERGQTDTYWHSEVKRLTAALKEQAEYSPPTAGDSKDVNEDDANIIRIPIQRNVP